MKGLWHRFTKPGAQPPDVATERNWPFADAPNVAVFTVREIVDGEADILHVSHDADDGSWQFLTGHGVSLADAKLVALRTILRLDESVADLADLPDGWQADRSHRGAEWHRSPAGRPSVE